MVFHTILYISSFILLLDDLTYQNNDIDYDIPYHLQKNKIKT